MTLRSEESLVIYLDEGIHIVIVKFQLVYQKIYLLLADHDKKEMVASSRILNDLKFGGADGGRQRQAHMLQLF